MSFNLGNEGVQACRALNTNEQFLVFAEAMREAAQKAANTALEASAENQASSIGYARALRDVFTGMVAAASNIPVQRVGKPGVLRDSVKMPKETNDAT